MSNKLHELCRSSGWTTSQLTERQASISFQMESGRKQRLYIIDYKGVLEFSVPSIAVFDSEDDIPDWLAQIMLRKNSEYRYAAWSVEKISGKHVLSLMYNIDSSLLSLESFTAIARHVLIACDDFEGALIALASRLSASGFSSGGGGGLDHLFETIGAEAIKTTVHELIKIWLNRE